jgi:hypothetical protein
MTGIGQIIQFTKILETKVNGFSYDCIYRVQLYNNKESPICIPVSLSFGLMASIDDTVQLSNVYPANDSILVLSFQYAKADLEGSATRYPALPIVLNPGTYLLTNVRFTKENGKKTILELKYSHDKQIDYGKIWSVFKNGPKYKWMDSLNFVNQRYQIF